MALLVCQCASVSEGVDNVIVAELQVTHYFLPQHYYTCCSVPLPNILRTGQVSGEASYCTDVLVNSHPKAR